MILAQKLFGFQGRLRRRDWWLLSLGLFAFETVVVKTIERALDGPSFDLMQGNVFSWIFADAANPGMFAIHAAIMLALLWPNLAIITKRAHDRDKDGYWLNGLWLISYATVFLPADLMERSGAALDRGDWVGGLSLIGYTVFGVAMLVTIVVLGFLDGTAGANRHGPSPKDGSEVDLGEVFD